MRLLALLIMTVTQFIFSGAGFAGNEISVAVLKYGTVNWELDVIKHHGLDKEQGIDIKIISLASTQATNVALLSGSAKIIVTDWLWVSRQRNSGGDFVFAPYSSSVGALMVDGKSSIQKISDLKGKTIGVAGGAIDKNWLLMRAVAKKNYGIDFKNESYQAYGAPPLLAQKAQQGELDAVLNYWHYCARLEAKGFRRLLGVEEAAKKLGSTGRPSILGYVFPSKWSKENPKVIRAFLKASQKAKSILLNSDEEWQRIKPLTKAGDERTLVTLRDRFREGIPRRSIGDEEKDARILFSVLAKLGGKKLVGSGKILAEGTFWYGQETED